MATADSRLASDVESPAPTVILRCKSLIASTPSWLGGSEDPVEPARVCVLRCGTMGYATAEQQHKCAISQPDLRAAE